MRIGLAGTGRIGAFHAKTLTTLAGVDDLVLADLDTGRRRNGWRPTSASARPPASTPCSTPASTPSSSPRAPRRTPSCSRRPSPAASPRSARSRWRSTSSAPSRSPSSRRTSGVPVHIGFQRRFDTGYRRVRDAVASGELGFVHTVRAATMDQAPPHAAYLPTSGGLFRDCSVHDFDILRFVTGREVSRVFAAGANKGEKFFTEAGRRRHRGGDPRPRRRHPRLGDRDPLQRRRPRRAHGGARLARAPSASGTTPPWPSPRPSRASSGPPARGTGRSWSASCRPTSPS